MVCTRHRAYTIDLAAQFTPMSATYSAVSKVSQYLKSAYNTLTNMVRDYSEQARSTYDEATNREGNYKFARSRFEPIFSNPKPYETSSNNDVTSMSTSEGGLPASQPVQLEDKVQLIDLNKPSLQKQREAYQAHTNNVLRYHPPIRSHELAHNIINERNIGELESAMQAFNEPTNQRIKQVHYVQR